MPKSVKPWTGQDHRGVGETTQPDVSDQKPSKPITDEIDRVLAVYYGFTNEELDFIINDDIKYRMGRESGAAPG